MEKLKKGVVEDLVIRKLMWTFRVEYCWHLVVVFLNCSLTLQTLSLFMWFSFTIIKHSGFVLRCISSDLLFACIWLRFLFLSCRICLWVMPIHFWIAFQSVLSYNLEKKDKDCQIPIMCFCGREKNMFVLARMTSWSWQTHPKVIHGC